MGREQVPHSHCAGEVAVFVGIYMGLCKCILHTVTGPCGGWIDGDVCRDLAGGQIMYGFIKHE